MGGHAGDAAVTAVLPPHQGPSPARRRSCAALTPLILLEGRWDGGRGRGTPARGRSRHPMRMYPCAHTPSAVHAHKHPFLPIPLWVLGPGSLGPALGGRCPHMRWLHGGQGAGSPLPWHQAPPGSLVTQRWGPHDRNGVACSGQAAPQEHVPCRKGGQASMKIGIPSPKRCARTAGGPVLGCHPSRYNEGG